jgi:beta-galactosidase/beta-glucuronidase
LRSAGIAARLVVPANEQWTGKRTILTIGAADFFTDCWCNGQHVGRNEGGYLPFEFDLTDALERTADGELRATIVLRVEDPMENREQPVGKQWGWYTSVSGIWQTVFLEPRAETFIERFEITTDREAHEAAFRIMTNGGANASWKCRRRMGRRFLRHVRSAGGFASGTIALHEAILWDPGRAALYKVRFHVARRRESRCRARLLRRARHLDEAAEEAGAPRRYA